MTYGRPPMPIGAHGTVRIRPRTYAEDGEVATWQALTYYRDTDGETRRVLRVGPSKAAAKRNLDAALTKRAGPPGAGITADTRLRVVAAKWLEALQRQVDADKRSPGTARLYRMVLDNHVLPRMGGLTVQEASVTRCNDCLVSITDEVGPPTAKTARAALSGLLGLAVRHGALGSNGRNPVRECAPIDQVGVKSPRAMTAAERSDFLRKLELDRKASKRDMPDLTRMMLATGCRIAEILAVTFDDVDLEAGQVVMGWQITRVEGQGLVRRRMKTKVSERTLRLPTWALSMLRRRKLRYGPGPAFPHATARRHPEREHLTAWRDPSNTLGDFREARDATGYGWFTSHVLRKTVASVLDEAGLSARDITDQGGWSKVSTMTDRYLGRGVANDAAVAVLEGIIEDAF